jgi:hypothetical protein
MRWDCIGPGEGLGAGDVCEVEVDRSAGSSRPYAASGRARACDWLWVPRLSRTRATDFMRIKEVAFACGACCEEIGHSASSFESEKPDVPRHNLLTERVVVESQRPSAHTSDVRAYVNRTREGRIARLPWAPRRPSFMRINLIRMANLSSSLAKLIAIKVLQGKIQMRSVKGVKNWQQKSSL